MNTTNPYDCSVVIRAFNEEKHLGRLLTGISQQSVLPREVVLVDSGSTDRTVEIALENQVKVVHITPSDFTFGRSLNLGIRSTNSNLVVFASAHVYPVYPDWLERLLEPFREPQVALTYGKQRGNQQSKFSEHQIFAQWFPNSHPPIQSHPFCNNANAAIRRTLWEQTAYDETLPGLEDVDWANKVMGQGKAIRYIPEAEIIHIHNETPAGVFRRYQREGMAFKKIFPHEKFLLSDFLRLTSGNIAQDLRDARAQGRSFGVIKEIIWFRVMQFWGTYQGNRQSGPLTANLRQRFYYPNQGLTDVPKANRDVPPIQYN
jgi:rhamnosyltransferase